MGGQWVCVMQSFDWHHRLEYISSAYPRRLLFNVLIDTFSVQRSCSVPAALIALVGKPVPFRVEHIGNVLATSL